MNITWLMNLKARQLCLFSFKLSNLIQLWGGIYRDFQLRTATYHIFVSHHINSILPIIFLFPIILILYLWQQLIINAINLVPEGPIFCHIKHQFGDMVKKDIKRPTFEFDVTSARDNLNVFLLIRKIKTNRGDWPTQLIWTVW